MARNKLPADHDQRRRIVEDLDTTMLVEAAAGTGKTTSLISRMLALLRTGRCTVDSLVAMTFTRKAAAELRSRFQIELESAARQATGEQHDRLAKAVAHIERCFIGTIHSFCARLLRERPIEASVDLSFEELEPEQDERFRENAWREYVASLFATNSGRLDELVELGLAADDLQSSFLQFAKYPDVQDWPAPTIELPNLGGARKALAEYVAHMDELIPTFPSGRGNDKLMSAYEDVSRLVRNRRLERDSELFELLELFTRSRKVVQKEWPAGKSQGKAEGECWQDFAQRIAQPLVGLWRAKRYATVIPMLREATAVYDQVRRRTGKLNYQDLLLRASELLRDKPAIRQYFRSRFSHVLVDEFQDTDPIQAEVLLFLTATDPHEQNWRRCAPVPGSLFIVGDPKQSIYRFRRADIVTYNQVREIILANGGTVFPLAANFRTIRELVEWGNPIFDHTFPAEANVYSPASCAMQVGREGTTIGDLVGIRVLEVPEPFCNKDASIDFDADSIARYIRAALDKGWTVPRTKKEQERAVPPVAQPGDFLIVTYRTGNMARYAAKLEELGISHQVTGGSALSQVPELQLLADCLWCITEPENPLALVAVLRGELFGFSDQELYDFRRSGGAFTYRGSLPDGLDPSLHQRFADTFDRLRWYAQWFKQLPPIAAVERVVVDLGLLPRALSASAGNLRAGSIGKAIEMLRQAQTEFPAVEDLVGYLRGLLEKDAQFDGLPARPHDPSVVRIMNLHKVKGLEAPVVFLADPTGKYSHDIDFHVDRNAAATAGYLAVYAESRSHNKPLLAHHQDWDTQCQQETKFREAEIHRLMYVAATRAGTQLVISRKVKANKTSYWDFFSSHLETCDILADPGPRIRPASETSVLDENEISAALADIERRWRQAVSPSYATAAAKQVAVSAAGLHRHLPAGEHGTEWGTVVHILLEAAMRDSAGDLRSLARSALEEHGLDASLADLAIQTVDAVVSSDLWRRAQAAERRIVEIPFQLCLTAEENETGLPTIIRGVIDLAFRENGVWVIVDYKTDAVIADSLHVAVEYYRPQVDLYARSWSRIINEPVGERGLFFVATRQYVVLQPV